jgi:hypothetical protein
MKTDAIKEERAQQQRGLGSVDEDQLLEEHKREMMRNSYVDAPSVIAVGIDPSTFGSSFNDLSPPNPVIRVTQNTPSVQLPIRELKYTHRRTAI